MDLFFSVLWRFADIQVMVLICEGWLISSWPEGEEDELYSSHYMHVQFNSLSDAAESLQWITFVIFLYWKLQESIFSKSANLQFSITQNINNFRINSEITFIKVSQTAVELVGANDIKNIVEQNVWLQFSFSRCSLIGPTSKRKSWNIWERSLASWWNTFKQNVLFDKYH